MASQVGGESTQIRDRMALLRTTLANERTFLSYTRTALAFAISGASAIHFLGEKGNLPGASLILTGLICAGFGGLRFASTWLALRREAAPQPPI